ncbi:UDP-forming cellulose synthase catalytic subunit [Methylobacterium planeticum]|uniref:Cellulose synthase catalytic subunit [UDP-forming] n=1 Tax=Methylobacterium planeticum TaxID=2615211 RepID=A0A6N6MVF8_9HYPH|nr:UDP-forming cellulose synthase catalytic subunit [Methylobacterium planeticum]KAB1073707.1 UDP-forming cellulose synthase catalytic subunit [Methylobacterium planeticum]
MPIFLVRLSWLVTTAVVVALLLQPVGTAVQLEMSLCAIAAMLGIWLFTRGRASHYVFLGIGSLVVIKYFYWRITRTLPWSADPLSLTAGLILLAAELYYLYILFLSLVINADPLNREPALIKDEDALPSVDIFVPSYNEDESILATTLAAARSLDYPADKLTVWLLDDGGTDQKCADPDRQKSMAARARRTTLQHLCEALGVRYLTRRRNLHAKAGNLNNGLAHATGDIVVVLDADHVPFRSFLRETIGHFARDPRLFLVQTPHAFLNPDPIERNLRTFERMPSENEMFYAIGQRGLDKWNGSFFCGSAALLRRKALDEAGGFSGITITEDCETAFELHARGWTSVYVDKPLIAGLQPDTLRDFIGQRSRWCQGMLQIMILKNPIFKRGLKSIQRLCYMSNMTYWFFPIPCLIFMFAPLLYIFFDMKIVVANVDEALAYTATYIIVNMMMQSYLYGRVRWPFVSELYEYVQGLFLIKATASVILSPRKPTFNVTAKNVTLDHDHLSPLALPFFIVYAILLTGSLVAAYRYLFEPGITNLMLVVGLWNLINVIKAGAALGVTAERRQVETTPSLAVDRQAVLTLNGLAIDVRVERVSAERCRLRMDAIVPMRRGDDSSAGLLAIVPLREGQGPSAASGTWPTIPVVLSGSTPVGEETLCECRFERLRPQDHFALADLMYGDAGAMTRFQARRRRHKNLFAGTAQFIWWGVTEPFRALSYAVAGLRTRRPAEAEAEIPVPKTIGMRRKLIGAAAQNPLPVGAAARVTEPAPDAGAEIASEPAGEPPPTWLQLMIDAENEALARNRKRRAADLGPTAEPAAG